MGPAGVALIPLRELIKELNIAGQPHPHVSPFDQVVAQDPLFGESSRQHAAESTHVIDPLAMVRPFTAQVLIDIGDSLGVRVNADCIGEEPAECRDAGARQGWAHPRLDDGVRAGHDVTRRIEARLIEGVRNGLDHSAGRGVGQQGVAVQGDDEAHVRKAVRVAHVDHGRGLFQPRAVDQAVQFLQLPPFALPADEFLLGFAPGALPMEQEKSLAAVALVERFQAFFRGLEQPAVVFARKRCRIGVVRKQAEEQIRFLVGQVADLQLLHLGAYPLRIRQHHRHDHQGAEFIGNTGIREIHLGEGPGRQESRDQVIDHLDRQLADRNQQEQ